MENLEEILSKIRSSSKLDFLIFDNYKKILHHPQDDVETLKLLLELGTLAIPLEYINMRDDYNNKLYCGDIVLVTYDDNESTEKAVICKGEADYFLIDKNEDVIIMYDDGVNDHTNLILSDSIIRLGNIFENPNLLYNEI